MLAGRPEGPTIILNHVDGSRNQVESLAESMSFWNQNQNFDYYSCKL